jgi:hypothetical protein
MGVKPDQTELGKKMRHLHLTAVSLVKRIDYLTAALRELEESERAANAFIVGHALVCPLVKEKREPTEAFPQIPEGEAINGL